MTIFLSIKLKNKYRSYCSLSLSHFISCGSNLEFLFSSIIINSELNNGNFKNVSNKMLYCLRMMVGYKT